MCSSVTVLAWAIAWMAWPSAATTGPGASSPATGGAAVSSPGLVVASLVGTVEIRTRDGWVPLRMGATLTPGAMVRTGAFSRGLLRTPDGSTLAIKPNSTVRVGADDAERSRFVIREGRVAADLPRREGKAVEFSAERGDARAESRGGRFQVVATREGMLGVVTETGSVDLVARGERVTVGAGQQAVALPGSAPTSPTPIPAQVFLEVKWPEHETTKKEVRVEGRAQPGAMVRVAGRTVTVGRDGRFSSVLPLEEGENRLTVIAQDLGGRVRRLDSPPVVRKEKEAAKPIKLKVTTEGSIWE